MRYNSKDNIVKKIYDKYASLSAVAKAPIWYAFCSIIQKCISFFTMPIFTNLLTTEQYGLFSIYQSWMSIILIFTTLNLQYGVFNNAMIKYKSHREEYIASMQGLVIVLNLCWLGLYITFKQQWNALFDLPTVLMVTMILEMTVTPALGFWSGKKRFEYRYREVIGVTLAMAILNPVIGIIAVLLTEESNRGTVRVMSTAFVSITFCLVIMGINFAKGKKFYVKEYWKYALGFNIPLVPYYLSQVIFNQSDRVMIDNMVGRDKAGIYSVVYNCSTVIVFIINAINNSFVPWTYQQLEKKEYRKLGKTSNFLAMFIGGILLLVMLVAPEVISIFAAPDYYEGIWVMPPIICSLFFMFIAQLFINVEFYKEKNTYLVGGSIFSAIINIVLNYILIPIFGYVVAGYTTLLSYIVFAIANYYFATKMINANGTEKVKIYDIKFLVALSVFMLCASFAILLTYRYFWIRAGLACIVLIACIIKRNKILELLKKLREK